MACEVEVLALGSRDHQDSWDTAPRSVPGDIGSFSFLSELCYFSKF